MADSEDGAAKAARDEKLAAAKKRIEELRKKKKPKKPKSDGPVAERESRPATPAAAEPEVPTVEFPDLDTPLPASAPPAGAGHSRTASLHARRISTSSGLRRPSVTGAEILRSGTGSPLSPTDLPDIYRKQATTISELTEAVERLEAEAEGFKVEVKRLSEAAVQRDKALEQLAAVKTDLQEAVEKAGAAEKGLAEREEEAEKLKSEAAALARQSSHLASQLLQKDQTISDLRLHAAPNQDRESLTAKEDQIETMEMEISKLRGELDRATKNHAETLAALARSEQAFQTLTTTHDTTTAELSAAQAQLSATSSRAIADAAAAESLVQSLQREVATLTATTRTQAATITDYGRATPKPKHRDSSDSRFHGTGATQQDSDDVDALEDAVRSRLQRRIQQLEAELRHKEPMLDVDLKPVQEEDKAELRRRAEAERVERVRDVKRGLETWRGWRLDLTVLGGGMGFGTVFEV